jgi:hypothetical protein
VASSCKTLREIYFSPYIPFNLILEIADPPGSLTELEVDEYYNFWGTKRLIGDLLNHLRRLQISFAGKPLTRFEFNSRWNFDPQNSFVPHLDMWTEILRDVSKIFGDELMVVVCAFGDDVKMDLIKHAPRRIQALEERERSLGGRNFKVIMNNASLPAPFVVQGRVTTRSEPTQLPKGVPDLRYPMLSKPQSADIGTSRPLALHI